MIRAILRRFGRSCSGAAAVEFVLWVGILMVPTMNVVDLSFYAYQRMQVKTAAQAAVQAAWHLCDGKTATTKIPVKNCTGALAVMQAAAQSTSLGTDVSLPAASVSEYYYCAKGSPLGLVQVGTKGSTTTLPTSPTPNSCTAVNGSSALPGDYLVATVSYTYKPIFSGMSILSVLGTSVTESAGQRID